MYLVFTMFPDAVAAAAACIENGMSVYSVKSGFTELQGNKKET